MEFFPSVSSKDETLAQIDRFIAHIDQYGHGFFAVERKDNRAVYWVYRLIPHPRFEASLLPLAYEIGWRLSKANWGQGFATEAALACLDFGFDRVGLDEIYASLPSIHNKRSEQVMAYKAGMVKQGEFETPLTLKTGISLKQHVLYKISRRGSFDNTFSSFVSFFKNVKASAIVLTHRIKVKQRKNEHH